MSESSSKSGFILMSVLLGCATVLSILLVFYMFKQKAENDRLRMELNAAKAEAASMRTQAERQMKEAAEQASICDLRITELEIKYDMCMTKR